MPIATVQRVFALAPDQGVVAIAAVDAVIAAQTGEHIVAAQATDGVIARSPCERVVGVRAHDAAVIFWVRHDNDWQGVKANIAFGVGDLYFDEFVATGTCPVGGVGVRGGVLHRHIHT